MSTHRDRVREKKGTTLDKREGEERHREAYRETDTCALSDFALRVASV